MRGNSIIKGQCHYKNETTIIVKDVQGASFCVKVVKIVGYC